MPKTDKPAIIVLFGITGDLAQRKLLPALYHLFKHKQLDERTVILGITRRDVSTEDMVSQVAKSVRTADGDVDPAVLEKVQSAIRMFTMSQTDPAEYQQLKRLLNDIENDQGCCMNRLFYLSIPPQMFDTIVTQLGEQGLNKTCSHGTGLNRLLIEKPFGSDLVSAHKLLAEINQWFDESQVFRIDHYIAKDSVQNILAFREVVPQAEALWNAKHISTINITVFEQLGIEGRASFYESVGALRDFVQSHLLQMLALVTMDLPPAVDSSSMHAERVKLLRSIKPIVTNEINERAIRGQYEGYRDEVGHESSFTETFAALDLSIKNDRWQGTNVRLQTGKAMAEKCAFVQLGLRDGGRLTFHIQPETGVEALGSLPSDTKVSVEHFNQSHKPSGRNPLGYEDIFLAAIEGNHRLFTTRDEVLVAWKVVDEVVAAWQKNGANLRMYPKGSSALE